jgi:hypothetical protein
MSKLPKHLGLLGGIVAFCAGLLVALLCECPPLAAARKAGLCALVSGSLVWVCAGIGVGVLQDGLSRRGRDQEDEL